VGSKQFTHLQVASGYSFKFGTSLPSQLVERAAQFGMTSLALTDHDGMAGAIRFSKACEEFGISPILGVNLSFIQKKYRITLLAQPGKLSSLYRLLTAVNMNSDEKVLTLDILNKFSCYSKDVFILHGPQSALADAIFSKKYNQAISIFNSTKELFADQSLECVSHLARSESRYSTLNAARFLSFARNNGIDAVLTNAVRMLDPSDAPVADILDASRKLVLVSDKTIDRVNAEAYLKPADQMTLIADEIARAAGEHDGKQLLNMTQNWAEKVRLSVRNDVGIGLIHLPEPSVLGVKTIEDLTNQLKQRCESQLVNRYETNLIKVAQSRLTEELATIRHLGFESYFLTVANIAKSAKQKGIRVAARGSGAGSIVCYLLGISGVEPLSNGLLMERFCSVLRNSLPDIDIDVESARRLEIYDDVFNEYGDLSWDKTNNQSRCATVSMVETYRARGAIRDVGAALGITPTEIDILAKNLPHIKSKNISRAVETIPELKRLNLNTPLIKTAIQLAARLDGLPRHLAMHPCAIALSDIKLQDFAPIERNQSGYPMLQFDKDDVEDIGLLKLDILGVRMQSAIAYTLSEIARIENKVIDIEKIDFADKKTFDLIKSTRTLGLFQIESPGQRELVGKFAPNSFNDLTIGISLFRPGPVKGDMITPFLETRQGFQERIFIHQDLEEVLKETEGVVVFHEQVIKIISIITGCSLAEADEKRRNLGSREGQQEICDWFYSLGLARGYELKVVHLVWKILRDFASFGFCKAHAAAFALPTYQSAWLKTHYTAAFIAGILTHDPGMYPKRLLIDEARQWGIEIAPIDVNKSGANYLVEKSKFSNKIPYQAPNTKSTGEVLSLPDARGYTIRVALSDIKNISEEEIKNIILNRPYLDLADFIYRTNVNSATTKALVDVGAFDELEKLNNSKTSRRDLYLHLENLQKLTKSEVSIGQTVLNLGINQIKTLNLPELTLEEQIQNELKNLGAEVTQHLLFAYKDFLMAIGAKKSSELIKERSGSSVLVAGVKVSLQTPPIRTGKRVMFLTLDDGNGCNDLTFFENAQKNYAYVIRNSSLILARGIIRKTGPRGLSIRAMAAWDLNEQFQKWESRNLKSN
jgi:error-prone DNA polymerase